MKIAIIGGTGREAYGLALRLARLGEEVLIGSRQPARAERRAAEVHHHLGESSVRGLENRVAAEEAEWVILTVPYAAHQATLHHIAEALTGKILIDTTVPLNPHNVRQLARRSEFSAAEEAQRLLGPGARVVAAFQNISAHALADLRRPIDCDVLVCGDEAEAKAEVMALIARMEMRAWDVGPLEMARSVEAITPLLISLNRRYRSKRAGLRITGLRPPAS